MGNIKDTFTKWFETFLSEKGIDQEEMLEFEAGGEKQMMPVAVIVEFMQKSVSKENQKIVKDKLVMIDFRNGNVRDFLIHIGKGIATL